MPMIAGGITALVYPGISKGSLSESVRLKLELADDHRVAVAAEDRPITFLAALKDARPGACLQRSELTAAQPFGPIRHQGRVGRAGHRVLVDAEIRDKDSASDVIAVPTGRDHRH